MTPLPPGCNKKSMLPNSGREMGSTARLTVREITRCIAIVSLLTEIRICRLVAVHPGHCRRDVVDHQMEHRFGLIHPRIFSKQQGARGAFRRCYRRGRIRIILRVPGTRKR